MPAQDLKPVVLLISANTGRRLTHLEAETDAIAAQLTSSGLCNVQIVSTATLTNVVTALNDPALRDRIVIVHYAGHANGQGIQLRSEDGHAQGELAHMRGLASILRQQPNLRLVFVNGCASREQVLELTQAGIPLIIATNQGIDDKVARDFAERLYITLAQKRSIGAAYQVAEGERDAGTAETIRSLWFGDFQDSEPAQRGEFPWEIHGPDDDRHWTLCDPYYRGSGPRWDHTKYELNEESPYMGLRYFSEKESDRFFGRDQFVEDLIAASERSPLLLVIGASGTGKSSLVRAGMIPAWKKRNRDAASPRAFVFTPEDDPFDQLSTELARVDTFDRQQVRELRKSCPTALRDACTSFRQGEPWLFFIDQFEQVFTRTKDEQKRADFLSSITGLAKANDPSVCLVLAIRDDFFPYLRDYPELFPITDRHVYRVADLDRKSLQEVIQRPAAEHGVMFQPGLVDDIIDAIKDQPGALPLLQYTLSALWEHDDLSDHMLNESTYNDLGGVTGSLGQRFEQLYNKFDDAGKNEFRWMMLKLVTYDQGAAGVSVVSRLAPKSEFTGQQAEFLDQLITEEKLVVSSGTSTPSVQLGHEKIIEAWPEYGQWTREYGEANSIRQQLSKAAREWMVLKGEGKKAAGALWQGSQLQKARELRQQREFDQLGGLGQEDSRFLEASHNRSQKMIRILCVAIAVAVVLGAWGWLQSIEAKNQNRAAMIQLGNAEWLGAVLARDYEHDDVRAAHRFAASAAAFATAKEPARAANSLSAINDAVIATFPHNDFVRGALFIGDESRVLSWSSDGTVRLWNIIEDEPLRTFRHDATVNGAMFNSDESRLLSWSRRDRVVRLWDTAQDEAPLKTFRHDSNVNGALFNSDESRLLSWSSDGSVRLWDTAKDEAPLKTFKPGGVVDGARFSGDASRVLSWGGGMVRLWDTAQDEPLKTFKPGGLVRGAMFSGDASQVLSWSSDGTARLWDIAEDELLRTFQHDGGVNGALFSGDESRLLSWSGDKTVRLWDTAKDWAPLKTFRHEDWVAGAMFSGDATRVLSWTRDGMVRLWDTAKDEAPLKTFKHEAWVNGARFSGDASRVLSWSTDGMVRLWDTAQDEPLNTFKLGGRVTGAMFSGDALRVLSWSDDGTVRLWDTAKDEASLKTFRHEAEVAGAMFSGDASRVLSWSRDADGTVRLWDTAKDEAPLKTFRHGGQVDGAMFSGDALRVLSWSDDGTVRLWDTAKDEVPLKTFKHETEVAGAMFSGDASRVLSWSWDGTARLWDTAHDEPLNTFKLGGRVTGAMISGDASRLIISGGDGVRLWDTAKDEAPLKTFRHEDWVAGAMFSGDASRVLSWSSDGTVRLWDTAKDEAPLKTFKHEAEVAGAMISGDASRVLSWSSDGTARLWDTAQDEPVKTFKLGGRVTGAMISGDASRVLSWSDDGTVRLLEVPTFDDASIDAIDAIKLELEVRTAATITEQGAYRLLKFDEWLEKRNQLSSEIDDD